MGLVFAIALLWLLSVLTYSAQRIARALEAILAMYVRMERDGRES